MIKIISYVITFLLMADAAKVADGLANKENMWHWIVLYWVLLTAKNAIDLFQKG